MSWVSDGATVMRVATRTGLLRGSALGAASVLRELARGRRDWLVAVHRHARDRPRALAICDGSECIDWAELSRRILSASAGLHRLGLRPGGRLALATTNRIAHVVASGAAAHIGAVVAPMSPVSGPDELRERLARCQLALVESELAEVAASALGASWRVVVPEGAPIGCTAWSILLASGGSAPRGRPDPDAPDVVLYTSGTTGRSKGSRVSTRGASPVTAFRYLDLLGIGPDTVLWTPCPLYHAAPFALAGLTFLLGGTVVLDAGYDEDSVTDRIVGRGVTHMFLVPVLLERLLRRPETELERLRAGPLRALVSSGAPLRADLKVELQRRFGPVLYDLYGATELGLVAIGRPGHNAVCPGAVGPPLAGIDTEIRDPTGRPVPQGEMGELFVRSDTISAGYEGDDPQADTVASPGRRWAGSGDLARLDRDGLLHVVGRRKEMVVSGGVNLFPGEIEAVLARHTSVREVAVAGVPDAQWGEAVHAWVVPEGEAVGADDLKAWVRAHLAAYKAPRVVHWVDALPRTPTGKVLKRELVAGVVDR
ncbi:MAG: acyl-CoA synthetase (AMP-forming)/AMP-acid ligase II [Myxococcota bacterium]|jgi:acyl-CoA synthetase (AMP-forming)/AMP-acid ligase II